MRRPTCEIPHSRRSHDVTTCACACDGVRIFNEEKEDGETEREMDKSVLIISDMAILQYCIYEAGLEGNRKSSFSG